MFAYEIELTRNAKLVLTADVGPYEPWIWFVVVTTADGNTIVKPSGKEWGTASLALADAWHRVINEAGHWTKVAGDGGLARWQDLMVDQYGVNFRRVVQAVRNDTLDELDGVSMREID